MRSMTHAFHSVLFFPFSRFQLRFLTTHDRRIRVLHGSLMRGCCSMHLSSAFSSRHPHVTSTLPQLTSKPFVRSLFSSSSSSLLSFEVVSTEVSSKPSAAMSVWSETADNDSERSLYPISELLPSSAYVHIPFCRRRCFYCDFPIVAVGERTEGTSTHMDARMANYVDLLCREIRVAASANPSRPLKTLFFGGGTPSLLPIPLLLRIIQALDSSFGIAAGAEISIEMDPGTFDVQSLRQTLEGGVTRVSMGVQSFSSELLKACGRAHGLNEVYAAIDAIKGSGLKNWSLDLISSLPHQTLFQWEHSLQEAVAAGPSHISIYDLQIEEGTLFNRWYKAGESPLPSDDVSATFYTTASSILTNAGFEHYEISNYAKQGLQCKHNLVYWNNLPHFAFGLGSTSYVDHKRFARPRKFNLYADFVESFETSGGQIDFPESSLEERILDTVMLSLRLATGLNLQQFKQQFGTTVAAIVCKALFPFASSGYVAVLNANKQPISAEILLDHSLPLAYTGGASLAHSDSEVAAFVHLTDPKGFLLSNEVISSIFSALPSGSSYLISSELLQRYGCKRDILV